jgi:hypothetical protein
VKDQKLTINDETADVHRSGGGRHHGDEWDEDRKIQTCKATHRRPGRGCWRRPTTRQQATVSVSDVQGKPVSSARSLQASRARASVRLVDLGGERKSTISVRTAGKEDVSLRRRMIERAYCFLPKGRDVRARSIEERP